MKIKIVKINRAKMFSKENPSQISNWLNTVCTNPNVCKYGTNSVVITGQPQTKMEMQNMAASTTGRANRIIIAGLMSDAHDIWMALLIVMGGM